MRLDLVALAVLATWLTATTAHATSTVISQEKSLYRNILIYEENGLRCMKFGTHDNGRQSCMTIANPDQLVFNLPKMLLAALYLKPNPARILVIGLGGGTVVDVLQKLLPGIRIDAVELDPAVIRVAKKYFSFEPAPGTNLYAEDGRVFVKHLLKKQQKYDMIMLDAFDHISVPEHMTTREFLLELANLLEPDGVLAANTFSSGMLHDAESATYFAVFGAYYNLKIHNRVILVKKDGIPDRKTIQRNAEHLEPAFRRFDTGKEWLLPLFATKEPWPAGTRLLTDQYSPANLLNGR
ncbi:MAG: fused MFS/spermidine synthase [Magnetococcales bacterium]|nr:fused MFS/spermidine synthase [Magnetococcales bacterium]